MDFTIDGGAAANLLASKLARVTTAGDGSDGVAVRDIYPSAYLKTLSDISNGNAVDIFRFIPTPLVDAIRARTSTQNVAAFFNTAILAGAKAINVQDGLYNLENSIDLRALGGMSFHGLGLPTLNVVTDNTPAILAGGERLDLQGFEIKNTALPNNTKTSAVGIRMYNLYESIIDRVYFRNVYAAIDQFQGLVNGGQNAFYSNMVSNIRIVQFSGWAIILLPFGGGNSGNVLDNIYINNRNSGGPVNNTPCLGGLNIQTSNDGVIRQLNIEWLKNSASLIVLNQAGNIDFHGLHFEGNYPTTPFQPLIDIPSGNKNTPMIDGLTLSGNDWTGFGGANAGALFRIDGAGTVLRVKGLNSYGNTTPANMALYTTGGASSYGSKIYIDSCGDVDLSLSNDDYTPRGFAGAVVPLLEHPLRQFNDYRAGQSAILTDSAGGTASSVSNMGGTITQDSSGLWDAANTRFKVKATGNYLCSVNVPASTLAAIQVKLNGVTIANLAPTNGNSSQGVQLSLSRNDTVQFTLASGSYTKTNVSISVSQVG